MGHSAAVWDYRAANEVTTDWSGNPQVVLRSPQGASAKVTLTKCFTLLENFGLLLPPF